MNQRRRTLRHFLSIAFICYLAGLSQRLAFGEDDLEKLTKVIEVSDSLWPEGEIECTMSTSDRKQQLKIWWMGDRCRRESVDLLAGAGSEVTISYSDSRSRTYYHPDRSTVYIFSKRQRPEEVAWNRARPDEDWTEIRSFISIASWWQECLSNRKVSIIDVTQDAYSVEVQKDALEPFPLVFNNFGLLVKAGDAIDPSDESGSSITVEWKSVQDGPPHPKKFVQLIKAPGDNEALVYRKIEVARFSPELKDGHPDLKVKLSDLPVGTLVIDYQGKESRTFIGGEVGERQYRLNQLARKLGKEN